MERIKKILFTVVVVLLVMIMAYNVYNFFSINILKKNLATVGGYGVLEVVSGSMEPTIHIGDMIVINTKDRDFKNRDIITFVDESDGSFVTHRIIEIDDNKIVTKGDNNDSKDDGFLSEENIIGTYQFRIPGGGKILKSFQSPFTMFMILVIGILGCIFISTDSEGNPILTDEEKEFQEYLSNKNKEVSLKEEKTKKESEIKKDSDKNKKKNTSKKKKQKKK